MEKRSFVTVYGYNTKKEAKKHASKVSTNNNIYTSNEDGYFRWVVAFIYNGKMSYGEFVKLTDEAKGENGWKENQYTREALAKDLI